MGSSQQAVDGQSHSAELIEQSVVLFISMASFVVVQQGDRLQLIASTQPRAVASPPSRAVHYRGRAFL